MVRPAAPCAALAALSPVGPPRPSVSPPAPRPGPVQRKRPHPAVSPPVHLSSPQADIFYLPPNPRNCSDRPIMSSGGNQELLHPLVIAKPASHSSCRFRFLGLQGCVTNNCCQALPRSASVMCPVILGCLVRTPSLTSGQSSLPCYTHPSLASTLLVLICQSTFCYLRLLLARDNIHFCCSCLFLLEDDTFFSPISLSCSSNAACLFMSLTGFYWHNPLLGRNLQFQESVTFKDVSGFHLQTVDSSRHCSQEVVWGCNAGELQDLVSLGKDFSLSFIFPHLLTSCTASEVMNLDLKP